MRMCAAVSVRNIDGKAYEDMLNDVATAKYYDWLLPCNEPPELRGSSLWHSEKEMDGWEALLVAIISFAAKEYVQGVVYNSEHMRKNAEDFLSEWSPEIMDGLQAEIRHARYYGQYGLERLLNRIRVMW